MEIEALSLGVSAVDCVSVWTESTDDGAGFWDNGLSAPFVVENIDVGVIGNDVHLTGYMWHRPSNAPFFGWEGDSDASGNMFRPWRGEFVLYNSQGIGWQVVASSGPVQWGVIISGHYELAYRPAF